MHLSPRTIYRLVATIIGAYVLAGCLSTSHASPAPHVYTPRHAHLATVSGTSEQANYQYRGTTNPQQALTAHWYTGRRAAPSVIIVHGGSWINGDLTSETGIANLYYSKGWQTFNIDYRRGPDVTWQQQVSDVQAAYDWVAAHAASYNLDVQKLSAYGFSAGGHLVAMLANTRRLQAVVSIDGVLQPQRVALAVQSGTDPDAYYLNAREEDMMGCPFPGNWTGTDPCTAAWHAFAPEFGITPSTAPMWIGNGEDDTLVLPATASAYGYWLGIHGVARSVNIYPGFGHTQAYVLQNATVASTMLGWVLSR